MIKPSDAIKWYIRGRNLRIKHEKERPSKPVYKPIEMTKKEIWFDYEAAKQEKRDELVMAMKFIKDNEQEINDMLNKIDFDLHKFNSADDMANTHMSEALKEGTITMKEYLDWKLNGRFNKND